MKTAADPGGELSRRSFWICALLLAIVACIELCASLEDFVPWGGDEALYVMHARNLAEGKPYADTLYIFNPANAIHPAASPPGLPLILAPAYRLAGENWSVLKSVPVVFF